MRKPKSTLKPDSCRNRACKHGRAHSAARFEKKCLDAVPLRLARKHRQYLKRLLALLDYMLIEARYFTRRDRRRLISLVSRARELLTESLGRVEHRLERRRSTTVDA